MQTNVKKSRCVVAEKEKSTLDVSKVDFESYRKVEIPTFYVFYLAGMTFSYICG